LCTNQGFKSLVPSKTVKSDFLYYYFKSIKPLAEKRASGTTFKELSGKAFADLPLCLPPLPEQRAIVSKIEQIFSKLDNGISNFKLAQEQLKVYRQAVLKKAFEGELTKKWREQQTDLSDAGDLLEEIRKERENAAKVSDKRTKKKIIQSPESVYEDNLPEKWCWVRVDSILFESKKGMTTGPFGTALKKHEHQKSGIPVYGIENIGEGVFRKPNKIFITEEKAKELQAFEVKPYDIIISRSGTVGEICSIPENIAGGIISTNLIRVRLDLRIISTKYFVYLFQGGNVREQVKELCKGSTRAFLNQTILSSINFPLCSLPEQQAIVQEIETRLSVCDKLEQDIAENLEKTEALRQSILKKAFEGKLLNERELTEVRGAEDWEPAEVLLERIKAERASKK
jgi:type I restriction enzyme S subunit